MHFAVLATVGLLGWPATSHADITAFLAGTPTGSLRFGQGIAAGAGLVVVGFEFEGARLTEDTGDGTPALSTGMANVLVQTPLDVQKTQFYGTAGAGLYRERLGTTTETSVGINIGGGVKIRVTGPLKLRLDYRVFRLQGSPLYATVHRAYAGATLGF
ncbi:MAG: hypothetical protein U0P30_02995 [Vicinamibacterales bacterium]